MQNQQILLEDKNEEDKNYTRSLISKYLNHKKLYIITFVILLTAGLFYLWIATPLYRIQSSIIVKNEAAGNTLSLNDSRFDVVTNSQSIENEIQIIRSNAVINNTVDKLNLNIGYYEKDPGGIFYTPLFGDFPFFFELIKISKGLEKESLKFKVVNGSSFQLLNNREVFLYNQVINYNGGSFKLIKELSHSVDNKIYKINVSSLENATESIKKVLSVSAPTKNASMLFLDMLYPSREKGVVILKTIVQEYNRLNIINKREQTDTLQNIIKNRINLLSQQLDDFQNHEQQFKINKQITNLAEDSKILLEKAKENDESVYQANLQLEILSALEKYISNSNNTVAPPYQGINERVLIDIVDRYNQLQLERKNLLIGAGSSHPLVANLDEQIAAQKKTIYTNINIQKSVVRDNLSKLNITKQALNNKISSIPVNERELLTITREKTVRENIYIFLLQKIEEASLNNVEALWKFRIIDNAFSSVEPVKPNKIIVFSTALFLGLLIPTVIINYKSAVNNKVTSQTIIKSKFSNNVIAEITRMRNFKYVLYQDIDPLTVEQFRLMRTRLERMLSKVNSSKKILVTSSTGGEGKVFVSINLAISHALNQRKTLLIDFDLRNPHIALNMNLPDNKSLNTYFEHEDARFDEIIVQNETWPYLYTLTSTKTNTKLHELPIKKLEDLFSYFNEKFEFIIINTPPSVVISDALQLEKFADINLFVIRHNYTDSRYLAPLNNTLNNNEFRNLYIVYNDVLADEIYGNDILKGEYFKNN